nr:hypothetical protein [uncultured Rhodopila sp.]
MRAPSPASSAPPDLSGDRAVTEWLEAQPGHLTFAKLLAAHIARFGSAGALSPQALWRAWLIQPVIRDTDPGSRERGAAIAEIARQTLPDWMGRARRVAEKTVRSWVADYATGGPAALARKPPSNRAQPRVHVSRAWDQAMRTAGIAEGTLAGIARALRDKVRLLWSDGRPNRTVVLQGATPFLMEQTRLAGLILPAEQMESICDVPRRLVESERPRGRSSGTSRAKLPSSIVPRVVPELELVPPAPKPPIGGEPAGDWCLLIMRPGTPAGAAGTGAAFGKWLGRNFKVSSVHFVPPDVADEVASGLRRAKPTPSDEQPA